jgi:sec-independent protein translocase protein TatA
LGRISPRAQDVRLWVMMSGRRIRPESVARERPLVLDIAPEDAMRLGFGEILVVLALALLFFGPSKLPQLGSSLGEAIRGFKKGIGGHDEEKQQEKLPPPGV